MQIPVKVAQFSLTVNKRGAVRCSDARFEALVRESAHQLGAHLVRGPAHPWAHAGEDYTEVCPPQSGHLTGSSQFSHGGFGGSDDATRLMAPVSALPAAMQA